MTLSSIVKQPSTDATAFARIYPATLADQGKPVSFTRLCDLLDIRDSELDSFARRLAAMEARGATHATARAYILPERASLIAGRVDGHADGYGFLIPG